jgi:hypothetical protein
MSNPVTEKLSRGADLSAADRGAITKMISEVRRFGPRQDVIREGDAPENVHAVLKGFACRYKTLPDGGRPDHGLPGAGRLLRPARRHPGRDGPQHRHPCRPATSP